MLNEPDQNYTTQFQEILSQLQTSEITWPNQLRHILGYLLATTKTEPLTKDQLISLTKLSQAKLEQGLEKLHDLITQAGRQSQITNYYLTDLLLISYLEEGEAETTRPVFTAEQIQLLHKKLSDWCETEWDNLWQDSPDLEIQNRRNYARKHYITHLYYAGNWERLSQVLDEGKYGLNKIKHFDPSTYTYVQDLNLGRRLASDAALSYEEGLERLPHLWRYSLLASTLVSRVDHYPAGFFEAMFRLGQEQEVLELIAVSTNSQTQIEALVRLANILKKQPERAKESHQLILQAYTIYKQTPVYTTHSEAYKDNYRRFGILESLILEAEASDFHIQEIKMQALEITHAITKIDDRIEALLVIAKQLVKAGESNEANEIVQQALDLAYSITPEWSQNRFLKKIAEYLAQQANFNQALEIAHSLPKAGDRAELLVEIAKQLQMVGEFDQARKILQQTFEDLNLSTISSVISVLAQLNDFEQAFKLANSITYTNSKIEALLMLAEQLVKVGQQEQANVLLQQASEMAYTITSEGEQSTILTKLAEYLARQGDFKQAIETAKHIVYYDVWSKAWALREVVEQLVKIDQLDWAKEIFKQVLDLSRSPYMDGEGAFIFVTLVPLTLKLGQLEQLSEAVYTSVEGERRIVTLARITEELTTLGQFEQAKKILPQLREVAHAAANEDDQVRANQELALELARQADFKQALESAHALTDKGVQADVLIKIAEQLRKAGQIQQMSEVLQQALESVQYADNKKQGKELRVMLRKLGGIKADFKRAYTLSNYSTGEYSQTALLIKVAEQLVKAGQINWAKEIIPQALDLTDFGTQENQAKMLDTIIEQLGEQHTAFNQPFVIVYGRGNKRDKQKVSILRKKIKRLSQQALFKQKLKKVRAISDVEKRELALVEIAEQLARHTTYKQALDLVYSISSETYDQVIGLDVDSIHKTYQAHALNRLAEHLTYPNDLQQALDMTRTLIPARDRAEILIRLAQQLIKAGQVEQPKEILQEAFALVPAIQNRDIETRVLKTIPELLMQLNEPEQAAKVARAIPNQFTQTEILIQIENHLWETNKPDVARKILRVVQHEWLLAPTRKSIVLLLPMVSRFLVGNPDLHKDILKGFDWADNFLKTV